MSSIKKKFLVLFGFLILIFSLKPIKTLSKKNLEHLSSELSNRTLGVSYFQTY